MLQAQLTAVCLVALGCAPAWAVQTGVIDQTSPFPPGPPAATLLDCGPPAFAWQQEVRAGMAGRLEGFSVTLEGPAGAQVEARLRLGPGWNTAFPVVVQTLTKTSTASQQFFVNCLAANIQQVDGALFVIELVGNNTGALARGSYAPPPTAPLYPRSLFRGGPGCFGDCGTRLSFRTFVLTATSTQVYCTAKVNSLGCLPAIASSGTPSATASSGFLIRCNSVRNNKVGLLLYGSTGRAALPFQGGTLCMNAPIKRSVGVASGGTPAPVQDCSGIYSLDMNSFAQGLLGGTPHPFLRSSGTTVDCQYWGRDPGFPPPFDSTVSDALEYTVP